MREDLTRFGVEETRTPEEVDRVLAPGSGTVMMVINSVCGCAAGKARPGIGLALQHPVRPNKAATVFAGGDEAAVAHVRAMLKDYPPSSPSVALFQDGKPVYMLHRSDIERRDATRSRSCSPKLSTNSARPFLRDKLPGRYLPVLPLVCRAMVWTAEKLVPASARDEWREEHSGQLWQWTLDAAAAGTGDSRFALKSPYQARRSAALQHAF